MGVWKGVTQEVMEFFEIWIWHGKNSYYLHIQLLFPSKNDLCTTRKWTMRRCTFPCSCTSGLVSFYKFVNEGGTHPFQLCSTILEVERARVGLAAIKNHTRPPAPAPGTTIWVLLRGVGLRLGIRSTAPFCFTPSFFFQQDTVSQFSFELRISAIIFSGLTLLPNAWFRFLLSIANFWQRNIICSGSSVMPPCVGQFCESFNPKRCWYCLKQEPYPVRNWTLRKLVSPCFHSSHTLMLRMTLYVHQLVESSHLLCLS